MERDLRKLKTLHTAMVVGLLYLSKSHGFDIYVSAEPGLQHLFSFFGGENFLSNIQTRRPILKKDLVGANV